jgi:hypothetical protein
MKGCGFLIVLADSFIPKDMSAQGGNSAMK